MERNALCMTGLREIAWGRLVKRAGIFCLLPWLSSCGGSAATPTVPTPTPAPTPVRSVLTQGNFSMGAPDPDGTTYFRRVRFENAAAGALDTTVEWTYPSNTLWMYEADGECTVDQFASDACPDGACPCKFVVVSELSSPKPRVLSIANAGPGVRTLFVWNLGPREDACSYQAVLTSSGTGVGRSSTRTEPGSDIGAKRARPLAIR